MSAPLQISGSRLMELERLLIQFRNEPENTTLAERIAASAKKEQLLNGQPDGPPAGSPVEVQSTDLDLLIALCAIAPKVAESDPAVRVAYADALHGLPAALRNPRIDRKQFAKTYLHPFFTRQYPGVLTSAQQTLLTQWRKTGKRPLRQTLIPITLSSACLLGLLAPNLKYCGAPLISHNYRLTDLQIEELKDKAESDSNPESCRMAACRLFMHYRQMRDEENTEVWRERLKGIECESVVLKPAPTPAGGIAR